jgi:AraC-like DNA-binding protein
VPRELPRGYYRELEPPADLRTFVACGWIKVVRQTDAGARVPILPDGCADIMTYDDSPPFVVGPDPVTRWVPLPEGLVIAALRLRPGAARAILGIDVHELLAASATLTDLVSTARTLRAALRSLEQPAARLARLQDWVRARLDRASSRDRAVIEASRTLARDPRIAVDAVAAELGWSARTLHREFVGACGYGPKYLQRVMRVQGAIRYAHAAGAPSLSSIAAKLGFADQAHMTRDFRSITGFTPGVCLAGADAELGRWLDEEWS